MTVGEKKGRNVFSRFHIKNSGFMAALMDWASNVSPVAKRKDKDGKC